jgi:hypothetical protein
VSGRSPRRRSCPGIARSPAAGSIKGRCQATRSACRAGCAPRRGPSRRRSGPRSRVGQPLRATRPSSAASHAR